MRLLGGSEAMPMPRWMRHVSVDRTLMDYPGTTYFVPAANFLVPARPRRISYVVIHITGGPAMDEGAAVNTFLRGPASAQHTANPTGRTTQMVRRARSEGGSEGE